MGQVEGLDTLTKSLAECAAILFGAMKVVDMGWLNVWTHPRRFRLSKIMRSYKCKLHQVRLDATFRDVNFSARSMAKKEADLSYNVEEWILGRPTYLLKLEELHMPYFRVD
ncbi:hypothetical protein GIB67_034063 [Kingdonia uniflora]|uniref:Uncharacterized protein n=1 Tax=Kingdonia uniflora TaxID=39325 RepID=A0A7J7M6H1_9MAGN|nr:hypothetical protein GIB67_034063 [Kingdonia uniflora]